MGCLSASAEVGPEEAGQLGDMLTPWGAEKAGNKDGSIPPYTGGLTKPPASYEPGKKGVLTDPFADEKPLFSVNAANMAQHADKLSEGVKAALAKYPDARLDVYPSHRTATYPKWVVDNTLKNATQCKEVGPKLVNCVGGVPFPIPKTGTQITWNHQLAFMGSSFTGRAATVFTDASGKTLYLFASDHGTTSTCNGACAAAWPPLTASGRPTGTGGANAAMLGEITRSDGSKQVTYDHHPLYYYAGDSSAGDISGQGSTAFGGAWWIVAPSGSAITMGGSSSGSTGGSSGGSYGRY